ncbi:Cytochrome P450 [Operophtera brumata]|uniref:unspecific monooxygenase n=1 Tax=Operophtera brumata TaxID=104452 RepID=A0A0L7LHB7_OPEBR|nr:Cytochrome P450 [Operophtera brumata]
MARTMLLLVWGVVITAAAYLYFSQLYSRFSRHGVKNLPTLPLMGNMTRLMLRKEHMAEDIYRLYMAFPNERFVGKFEFTNPQLLIRDIELVKQITIKDVEHFLDRRTLIDEKADPLFGRILPAFTSSKMKLMLPLIVEVGEQMNKALKTKIENSGDLTTRYANDVIASCAFGLKVDSHTDVDNSFYATGKKTFNFNFKMLLMFFGFVAVPKLMNLFKISLFSEESKSFFRHLVTSTMKDREERNIIRPDMIHLLMEANKVWSQDDLVAQAVLFFLAGFETVSTTMSFLIHELALHPEVQERLVNEIRENEDKNVGKFNYNSIINMTYMDMVCTYLVGGLVFTTARHVYFPEPLKFDPERFSDENKHNINPFSYMPFGMGPRNCIGSRFALCEVKVLAYQLLQHMEVSPCEKTCIPSQLATDTFQLLLKGGHHVTVKRRVL